MKTTSIAAAAAAALLLLVACDEAKPTSAAPSGAASAKVADEDLSVPADFAEEADKQITADNYKSELDALSAEIK